MDNLPRRNCLSPSHGEARASPSHVSSAQKTSSWLWNYEEDRRDDVYPRCSPISSAVEGAECNRPSSAFSCFLLTPTDIAQRDARLQSRASQLELTVLDESNTPGNRNSTTNTPTHVLTQRAETPTHQHQHQQQLPRSGGDVTGNWIETLTHLTHAENSFSGDRPSPTQKAGAEAALYLKSSGSSPSAECFSSLNAPWRQLPSSAGHADRTLPLPRSAHASISVGSQGASEENTASPTPGTGITADRQHQPQSWQSNEFNTSSVITSAHRGGPYRALAATLNGTQEGEEVEEEGLREDGVNTTTPPNAWADVDSAGGEEEPEDKSTAEDSAYDDSGDEAAMLAVMNAVTGIDDSNSDTERSEEVTHATLFPPSPWARESPPHDFAHKQGYVVMRDHHAEGVSPAVSETGNEMQRSGEIPEEEVDWRRAAFGNAGQLSRVGPRYTNSPSYSSASAGAGSAGQLHLGTGAQPLEQDTVPMMAARQRSQQQQQQRGSLSVSPGHLLSPSFGEALVPNTNTTATTNTTAGAGLTGPPRAPSITVATLPTPIHSFSASSVTSPLQSPISFSSTFGQQQLQHLQQEHHQQQQRRQRRASMYSATSDHITPPRGTSSGGAGTATAAATTGYVLTTLPPDGVGMRCVSPYQNSSLASTLHGTYSLTAATTTNTAATSALAATLTEELRMSPVYIYQMPSATRLVEQQPSPQHAHVSAGMLHATSASVPALPTEGKVSTVRGQNGLVSPPSAANVALPTARYVPLPSPNVITPQVVAGWTLTPSMSSTAAADAATSAIQSSRASRNVYFRHLPRSWNTTVLRELCGNYGAVMSAKVAHHPQTNESLGYGFVLFEQTESAAMCVATLHHALVRVEGQETRTLLVRMAHPTAVPGFRDDAETQRCVQNTMEAAQRSPLSGQQQQTAGGGAMMVNSPEMSQPSNANPTTYFTPLSPTLLSPGTAGGLTLSPGCLSGAGASIGGAVHKLLCSSGEAPLLRGNDAGGTPQNVSFHPNNALPMPFVSETSTNASVTTGYRLVSSVHPPTGTDHGTILRTLSPDQHSRPYLQSPPPPQQTSYGMYVSPASTEGAAVLFRAHVDHGRYLTSPPPPPPAAAAAQQQPSKSPLLLSVEALAATHTNSPPPSSPSGVPPVQAMTVPTPTNSTNISLAPSNITNSAATIAPASGSTSARNVYLTNLPLTWNTTRLRELCITFGDIVSASVAHHPKTNESRGYGFVLFVRADDAVTCVRELQHYVVPGTTHVLTCRFARDKATPSIAYATTSVPDVSPCAQALQRQGHTAAAPASTMMPAPVVPSTLYATDSPEASSQLGATLQARPETTRPRRSSFGSGSANTGAVAQPTPLTGSSPADGTAAASSVVMPIEVFSTLKEHIYAQCVLHATQQLPGLRPPEVQAAAERMMQEAVVYGSHVPSLTVDGVSARGAVTLAMLRSTVSVNSSNGSNNHHAGAALGVVCTHAIPVARLQASTTPLSAATNGALDIRAHGTFTELYYTCTLFASPAAVESFLRYAAEHSRNNSNSSTPPAWEREVRDGAEGTGRTMKLVMQYQRSNEGYPKQETPPLSAGGSGAASVSPTGSNSTPAISEAGWMHLDATRFGRQRQVLVRSSTPLIF